MRFGVVSTANIASVAVVPAIRAAGHEVLAVGSRDADRAASFADDHDIDRSYGSYDALLDDPDLDAAYVPTPNAVHGEPVRAAADRGLDVLCEKPLAVDASEARDLGAHCEAAGVTLMEAFMYRYHPRTERAAAVAADLGDLRTVEAAFRFPLPRGRDDVRLDPELAGGSLMDVGCYAVSAARLFLGEPDRAYATANDSRDAGVDTEFTGVLEFSGGATATVGAGFDTVDTQRYHVEGTDGSLRAEGAFVPRGDGPTELTYETDGRTVTERFDPTDQYRLQVEHFVECVREGRRPRTDAAEAARNMAAVDALAASADRGEPVAVADDAGEW
jgi:xylose dehydrogenase (NAD/NADP)